MTPEWSRVAPAVWFSVLTTTLIFLCSAGELLFFPLVAGFIVGGGPGFGIGMMGLVFLWLAPVVVALAFVVLWGLVAHFILVLATSEHRRLGRTYQAVCYSAGTTVVGVSVISQWPTVDVLVGRADQTIVQIPEEVFENKLAK